MLLTNKLAFFCALLFLITTVSFAQVANNKDFSKDVAVYQGKAFLLKHVLDSSVQPVKLEIHALAASESGDLTTLVYDCPSQQKRGLLFVFYQNVTNSNGVTYKPYAYRQFSNEKAMELLDKMDQIIDGNIKYLRQDDASNIFFQYEDITILCGDAHSITGLPLIRVFWGDYDAAWDYTAFKRTRKRLRREE